MLPVLTKLPPSKKKKKDWSNEDRYIKVKFVGENKETTVKTTLETSGEVVKTTLETSGEDVKLHPKRVEKIIQIDSKCLQTYLDPDQVEPPKEVTNFRAQFLKKKS